MQRSSKRGPKAKIAARAVPKPSKLASTAAHKPVVRVAGPSREATLAGRLAEAGRFPLGGAKHAGGAA